MRSSPKLASLLFLYLVVPSFAHVPPAPPCTDTKATPTPPPVQNKGATATHHSTIEFGADSSLKGWCKTADFPDLCISIIAPHINEKTTLHNVMDISIQYTINITMKTLSVCKELAKAPPPSVQAAALNDILTNIAKALDYYKQAHDALIQHHWEAVNTYLGAAHKSCLIPIHGHAFFNINIHNEINLLMLRNLITKLTKMNSNCIALGLLF